MEKKKLLLIGNNELSDDFSSIINEYDMVVRVNRMTNYENCKGKTDLWLCDVHPVALELYEKEEPKKKFTDAKSTIIFRHSISGSKYFLAKIGYKGSTKIINFNVPWIKTYIPSYQWDGGFRVTNSFWMLIYCLNNFREDYEISILGIGDRSYLDSEEHKFHRLIFKEEQALLERLINEKVIKSLDFNKI